MIITIRLMGLTNLLVFFNYIVSAMKYGIYSAFPMSFGLVEYKIWYHIPIDCPIRTRILVNFVKKDYLIVYLLLHHLGLFLSIEILVSLRLNPCHIIIQITMQFYNTCFFHPSSTNR